MYFRNLTPRPTSATLALLSCLTSLPAPRGRPVRLGGFMSCPICYHLNSGGVTDGVSHAHLRHNFCHYRHRSNRKTTLQPLVAQDFACNLFAVNYLRAILAISMKTNILGEGEGGTYQTVWVALARQSSQKPLSLMSIHSTACEEAMAQRNSSQ